MTTATLARTACFMLAVAVAGPGLAASNEQRASFSVAVTLHTAVKPLSVAELCRDGRPFQVVGASIEVDCTKSAPPVRAGRSEAARQPATSSTEPPSRPEVTVVF